jgi:hypothetical protein
MRTYGQLLRDYGFIEVPEKRRRWNVAKGTRAAYHQTYYKSWYELKKIDPEFMKKRRASCKKSLRKKRRLEAKAV